MKNRFFTVWEQFIIKMASVNELEHIVMCLHDLNFLGAVVERDSKRR